MKIKILVVDDDPDIATTLRDRLESLGYDTITARDGLRALELIEQDTPNLVLLDLEMPKLSGLGVLKQLSRHRQNGLDLPVIVMTAHGSIAAAVEAMKEGAYDFLTKPFDVDHLSIVIRKAVERESLSRHVACLRSEVETRYATIVGTSQNMSAVMEAAQRAFESRPSGAGHEGLFIESNDPLPVGTKLMMEFALPDYPSEWLGAKGTVAWVCPKADQYRFSPGMGVRFTEISEEGRARLVNLVKSLNQARQRVESPIQAMGRPESGWSDGSGSTYSPRSWN